MTLDDWLAREVADAVGLIRPILAGRAPETQGAIIADLLAIWLAGHHVAGDREATLKLRAEMLSNHLVGVEELTAIKAKIMGTTP